MDGWSFDVHEEILFLTPLPHDVRLLALEGKALVLLELLKVLALLGEQLVLVAGELAHALLGVLEVVLDHAAHAVELEGLLVVGLVVGPLDLLGPALVPHLLVQPLLLHALEVLPPRVVLQVLSVELPAPRHCVPVLPVWVVTEEGLFRALHIILYLWIIAVNIGYGYRGIHMMGGYL